LFEWLKKGTTSTESARNTAAQKSMAATDLFMKFQFSSRCGPTRRHGSQARPLLPIWFGRCSRPISANTVHLSRGAAQARTFESPAIDAADVEKIEQPGRTGPREFGGA
jgi:hypothetical protein